MNKLLCLLLIGAISGSATASLNDFNYNHSSNEIQRFVDEDGRTWDYCLTLKGSVGGRDTTFVVYTDDENLSFHQVWQSIISSDSNAMQNVPEYRLALSNDQ